MTAAELVMQLRGIALEMDELGRRAQDPRVAEPSSRLEAAASEVGRAWSGSPLGYHSCVYYEGLSPPPPGAHFSSEWGFHGVFQGTTGDWREYDYEDVVKEIRARAGNPDTTAGIELTNAARHSFEESQSDVVSILSAFLKDQPDDLLTTLRSQAEKVIALTVDQGMRAQLPTGQYMSRDSTAVTQGLRVAPHQAVLAESVALRSPFGACEELNVLAGRAAAHIERLSGSRVSATAGAKGRAVFIGHGRSPLWLELKDFVRDRLRLPWEEFNRVPAAGVTNIARLSQMLDAAGVAFLVLTGEDERVDGTLVARLNVIHEAGLFQGRLGFSRAILLVEEACAEFSNVQGLGQIRFPAGQIRTTFEEVRRVLEREGFLDAEAP